MFPVATVTGLQVRVSLPRVRTGSGTAVSESPSPTVDMLLEMVAWTTARTARSSRHAGGVWRTARPHACCAT